jgi:outer membrane lipoprotein-sorting protein
MTIRFGGNFLRALMFALALTFPLLASVPAFAQPPVGSVDQAIVDRALTHLNSVRSFKARFIQRDQKGGKWTGQMWMERPNRLRFQYDPPESDVIWSDQGLVKHYDAELDAVTHVPRYLTPAWFLLDDPVRITKDVTLLATSQDSERYFIAAAQEGILSEGHVTLAFSMEPERLIGWTVTDSEGSVTQVDLFELDVAAPMPKRIFRFEPPESSQ